MRKKVSIVVVGALALVLAIALPGLATVSTDAGFEGADGNLAPQALMDWNSFAPTTWTGTAPTRTSSKIVNGWDFRGLEDWQVSVNDSAFAGGTKQDDVCPSVISAKAPNKDDLKRVYVASKTVGTDVFLALAWVRIRQNTTSPSAHVAFEFNQSSTLCGPGSDGLVQRSTANGGDMLIVYDFAGGSGDDPTLRLSRWTGSGPCEVASNTPPCWSVAVDLTAGGFAEGQVNTTASVQDNIAPTPPSLPQTLGLNEFGEAIINLTDAGVFSSNTCVAFGKVYAVSRTSGSSSTAQMKDLVGPGNVNIANCGRIIIRKATVPSPDPTDTTFNYTTTGGLSPSTFGLKNGESRDYGSTVLQGNYSVTEADPSPNFLLTSINCSASNLSHGSTVTPNVGTRTVAITLNPQDTVDCTFTNTRQTGAIEITKLGKDKGVDPTGGDVPLAGAHFEIKLNGNVVPGAGDLVTGSNGKVCFAGLAFGTYTVNEKTPPTGYQIDDTDPNTAGVQTFKSVTVSQAATCSSGPKATVTFTDTPLSRIGVGFDSIKDGATTATIECTGDLAPSNLPEGQPRILNNLVPGTYSCTVVIDP